MKKKQIESLQGFIGIMAVPLGVVSLFQAVFADQAGMVYGWFVDDDSVWATALPIGFLVIAAVAVGLLEVLGDRSG